MQEAEALTNGRVAQVLEPGRLCHKRSRTESCTPSGNSTRRVGKHCRTGENGTFGYLHAPVVQARMPSMTRITCSQCDRTIPPDSIQEEVAFCPYCGKQQGIGKSSQNGLGSPTSSVDVPDPPIEEVSFSLRESIGRYIGSVIVLNTVMASVIGGLSTLLFLSFALAGQIPVIMLPFAPVMLFVMTWAFTSIVSVPMMLYFTLFLRSRRIEAEGTLLHFQIGRKQKTINMAEHRWQRCGSVAVDFYGSYFWTRPDLKVVSDGAEYAFGFDEETAARWRAYLEAHGVKENPKVRWPRVLVASMLISCIGGALGTLLEPLFAVPNAPQGSVIFIGFLDGLLIGLFYHSAETRQKLGSNRLLCAVTMALLFAMIGVKAGGIFAWQVYSINAAVGAVTGWFVWQEEQEDRKTPAG